MLTHVVMWNLNGNKEESARFVKERIESMISRVPQITDLQTGRNIDTGHGNRDFVLITRHRSVEEFEAYQTHEYHEQIKLEIADYLSDRASVDFHSAD